MVSELRNGLDGERTSLSNLKVVYRHFRLVTNPDARRLRNMSP